MNESNGLKTYQDILQKLNNLNDKFDIVLNFDDDHKIRSGDSKEIDDPISEGHNPDSLHIEVLIKPKAYLKMAIHAIEFANDNIKREDWVEVIGLLTGKFEFANTPLERIIVEDYWPIGTGDAVSVNILSAEPVMEVYKNKSKDDFIVGWAHSHPSYTPFLSKDDIETQLRYQALWEESIAIVIDPAEITLKNHGFEVYRLNKSRGSYFSLRHEIDGMSGSASYETLKLLLIEKQLKSKRLK